MKDGSCCLSKFHHRCFFREGRASLKPCQADKETKHTTTIQICFVEGGSWLWWGVGQVGALYDTLHLICSHWMGLASVGGLTQAFFCTRNMLYHYLIICSEIIMACSQIMPVFFNTSSVTDVRLHSWTCKDKILYSICAGVYSKVPTIYIQRHMKVSWRCLHRTHAFLPHINTHN